MRFGELGLIFALTAQPTTKTTWPCWRSKSRLRRKRRVSRSRGSHGQLSGVERRRIKNLVEMGEVNPIVDFEGCCQQRFDLLLLRLRSRRDFGRFGLAFGDISGRSLLLESGLFSRGRSALSIHRSASCVCSSLAGKDSLVVFAHRGTLLLGLSPSGQLLLVLNFGEEAATARH